MEEYFISKIEINYKTTDIVEYFDQQNISTYKKNAHILILICQMQKISQFTYTRTV